MVVKNVQACCSLNEDTIDFVNFVCLLIASQHPDWVLLSHLFLRFLFSILFIRAGFPLSPVETQPFPPQLTLNIKYLGVLSSLPTLVLYALSEADKVSRQEWQLLTAIHDEADVLVLCDDLQGYDRTHYHHLCFGLVKTDIPQLPQNVIMEFPLQSCRYALFLSTLQWCSLLIVSAISYLFRWFWQMWIWFLWFSLVLPFYSMHDCPFMQCVDWMDQSVSFLLRLHLYKP